MLLFRSGGTSAAVMPRPTVEWLGGGEVSDIEARACAALTTRRELDCRRAEQSRKVNIHATTATTASTNVIKRGGLRG